MRKILIFALAFLVSGCGPDKAASRFTGLDLPKHSAQLLQEDFDLLVLALKEAHTGLYWYSTAAQFDSVAKSQRLKIRDNLNTLEFYNIVAPLIAFSKEDHCDITLPENITSYFAEKGKFLPVAVMNLDEKAYIINNLPGIEIKGHQLLEIDNASIGTVYDYIFNTFAADGFIQSSKYRYLDYLGLAKEYAKTISQPESFEITTLNPKTGKKERHRIMACNFQELKKIKASLRDEGLIKDNPAPATLQIEQDITVLSVNTFSDSNYEEAGMNFKTFIRTSFDSIIKTGTQNLIIDLRENGGGTEGNEDFLFSFLAGKPYNKYKYVQASGFTYSFLDHTDYKDPDDRKELETDLKKEHFLAKDGRILRKPDIEPVTPLQRNRYQGNVYVLTSGWTYSGGAEFSSLMREHTKAVFVGEEAGGGYYGNTSGYSIELTLPVSGIIIDIPLLKFVLDVTNKVPLGRGVIPDHEIQPGIKEFLEGRDAVMEFTLQLIERKRK